MAELDAHWTMEDVADANEFLDYEQDAHTALQRSFEAYKEHQKRASEAPIPIDVQREADELLIAISQNLRNSRRDGAKGDDLIRSALRFGNDPATRKRFSRFYQDTWDDPEGDAPELEDLGDVVDELEARDAGFVPE